MQPVVVCTADIRRVNINSNVSLRRNHNLDKKDSKDIAVIVIATVLALLLLIGVMVYVVHQHKKKSLADELILSAFPFLLHCPAPPQ